MNETNYGINRYSAGDGLLYNGIQLPKEWPPRNIDPMQSEPIEIPYLKDAADGGYRPEVIDITVGRQLFVDDFLLESNELTTVYHRPTPYENNPILKAETPVECAGEGNVTLSSGGVFYDMDEKKYRMWYDVGFNPLLAYAESEDGVYWVRKNVPGKDNNIVLDAKEKDGIAPVFIDYYAPPEERYKLFLHSFRYHKRTLNYAYETIRDGVDENDYASILMVSADGFHWKQKGGFSKALCGDATSVIYHSLTGKWVNSIRTYQRTQWRDKSYIGRVRYFAEHDSFEELLTWGGDDCVFWLKCDELDDTDRVHIWSPQMYHFNAIDYESIALGFFQIWRGPENFRAEELKIPKITEIIAAYSRDGFHYSRPDRDAFLPAAREDGHWDKGYVFAPLNSVVVDRDTIRIYYSAFSGHRPNGEASMHGGSAIGMAILRRDGFASLEGKGALVTRTLTVNGGKRYFFVNLDASEASLRVELQDEKGNPIEGFSMEDCRPVGGDNTCCRVSWRGGEEIGFLNGKRFRVRMSMEKEGKLYAFWLSENEDGASGGAVGSGYTGA